MLFFGKFLLATSCQSARACALILSIFRARCAGTKRQGDKPVVATRSFRANLWVHSPTMLANCLGAEAAAELQVILLKLLDSLSRESLRP